jgi:hypothetical protein
MHHLHLRGLKSISSKQTWLLAGLLSYPEYGGDTFLRNVCGFLQNKKKLQLRKLYSKSQFYTERFRGGLIVQVLLLGRTQLNIVVRLRLCSVSDLNDGPV